MPISERQSLTPGDIVVVPFPYSDRFAEKRRPALVVSSDRLNRTGFVWLAMITSAKQARLPEDVLIRKLAPSGLSAPSLVRPVKIACAEPSRILRSIGRLDPKETSLVVAKLHAFIGSTSK
ncbi:MAG: type II toxin-antitoxin system PemK/MazF family toxin [Methylobacteriaceae bacterium]|nr:type II toxin-antitoxin system PemK/MazF family toxin [Methylobacteriaceae bacterium]